MKILTTILLQAAYYDIQYENTLYNDDLGYLISFILLAYFMYRMSSKNHRDRNRKQ